MGGLTLIFFKIISSGKKGFREINKKNLRISYINKSKKRFWIGTTIFVETISHQLKRTVSLASFCCVIVLFFEIFYSPFLFLGKLVLDPDPHIFLCYFFQYMDIAFEARAYKN
jgi:hypothetical protein